MVFGWLCKSNHDQASSFLSFMNLSFPLYSRQGYFEEFLFWKRKLATKPISDPADCQRSSPTSRLLAQTSPSACDSQLLSVDRLVGPSL